VLKVLHKDVYLVDVPKKGRFHRMFYISMLKKFIKDDKNFYPYQELRPNPDYKIWDKMIGQVSGIVGKKTQNNEAIVYQCTMHRYPPSEYQWIGAPYLKHVPYLVQAFKEREMRAKTIQTIKRKAPKH
jgi:hypothetical protein